MNGHLSSRLYQVPAEWEPHAACWLAWPAHADLWLSNLNPCRLAFVELCRAIADYNPIGKSHRAERLEGGAIDVDGIGTCLTTQQCLLNPNRNPKKNISEIERDLEKALGVTKVLWLRRGLANDHTDGHVDNLARFVAPGVAVCMAPSG